MAAICIPVQGDRFVKPVIFLRSITKTLRELCDLSAAGVKILAMLLMRQGHTLIEDYLGLNTGIARIMNSSNRGTVKAISP